MEDSVFLTQMQAVVKQMETMWEEALKLLLDSNQCHRLNSRKEKYQLEIEELL
jgi:hypothetical protein